MQNFRLKAKYIAAAALNSAVSLTQGYALYAWAFPERFLCSIKG